MVRTPRLIALHLLGLAQRIVEKDPDLFEPHQCAKTLPEVQATREKERYRTFSERVKEGRARTNAKEPAE
jgi:hypothetical protein